MLIANQPTTVTYPNCRDCKWCAKKSGLCLGFHEDPARMAQLDECTTIYFSCARSVIALCGVRGNWFEPKTPGEISPGECCDWMDELGLVGSLEELQARQANKGQPV